MSEKQPFLKFTLNEESQIVIARGLYSFPGNEWRTAITRYLEETWSGNRGVADEPQIDFGGVILRLRPDAWYGYVALKNKRLANTDDLDEPHEGSHHGGPCGQWFVETKLARLVKDPYMASLRIDFKDSPNSLCVCLNKGRDLLEVRVVGHLPSVSKAPVFYGIPEYPVGHQGRFPSTH